MDNQGELHKYFVIVFENAWNANLYKFFIQEQLWALFKLRNVYFVLSNLQLNCYKRVRCATLVSRKGLPSSSGTCLSSSISITTKSTRKMNFPTLISTSSRIPSG